VELPVFNGDILFTNRTFFRYESMLRNKYLRAGRISQILAGAGRVLKTGKGDLGDAGPRTESGTGKGNDQQVPHDYRV
jgi:hypothetical protein